MPTTVDTRVDDQKTETATWNGLLANQSGDAWKRCGASDKTFHVFGPLGGSTVKLQGSNDPRVINDDPAIRAQAAWSWLRDPDRNVIAVASLENGLNMDILYPNPIYIRPVVEGGDGSTLVNVVICGSM
jgi:hypothetical protein